MDRKQKLFMDIENIKSRILASAMAIPEVAAWPEISTLIEVTLNQPGQFWKLPLLSCQAVGGDVSLAIPLGAAIACVHPGFVLVDDMLDDDPRGLYHSIGCGRAANLAFALQSASIRLIGQADIQSELRAEIANSFAETILTTALGQHWDVQNQGDEADYWKILHTKNTPLFGFALYMGARVGKANPQIATSLHKFGTLISDLVQLYDDLKDAFEAPASPDWQRPRNNLLILYAMTANHTERDQFRELVPQIGNAVSLQTAQQILIHSGAVSYCAYHVSQRYQQARQLLENLALVNPEPLAKSLAQQIEPLARLFQSVGVEMPLEPLILR
jgi:geranylgeranyl pyrophosphate synthase